MACCEYTIVTFGGVSETNIGYTGSPPDIQVMYMDGGVLRNIQPVITLDGSNININHGGPAVGIVKISA